MWWKTYTSPAAVALRNAKLTLLSGEGKSSIIGEELWKKHGALVMVIRRAGWPLCQEEAAGLSSLKPLLDKKQMNLIGVVHENHSLDVFQQFLKGPIYLDPERVFYGPEERWLGLSGLLSPSLMLQYYNSRQSGFKETGKGEGRLLGSVFVVGPKEQGIVYHHMETYFGDHANLDEVKAAIEQVEADEEAE